MYSIVMMAALTGSADLPAFGHRGGCCGCNGGGYSCCGCGGGGHRFGHRRGGCGCCGNYSCGCCGNNYSCGCCGNTACCTTGGESGGQADENEGDHERQPMPKKQPEKIGKPKDGKKATRGPAPATVIVSLPADAKLTFDGTVTKSTSATRVFTSPALQVGEVYYYNLKAEVVQDGKTITLAKTVAVRAGNETSVSLFPETSLALR